MTHEDYAARIVSLPECERPRAFLEVYETGVALGSPLLLLVGLVLRGRNELPWAEYAFNLCQTLPNLRAPATYELAVLESMRHRTAQSILLYEELERDYGLNAYQNRTFATQLTISGRFSDALSKLDVSARLDPGSTLECWMLAQLVNYCERFPVKEAVERARDVRESYEFRSAPEVIEDVTRSLAKGEAYSLVRMNDGEGSLIDFGVPESSKFSELYAAHRRYYCKIWFGDPELAFSSEVSGMSQDMDDAFALADCMGAEHTAGVEWEYGIGSLRLPLYNNIVRKLESAKVTRRGSLRLTHPMVNHILMAEGHLERLLSAQSVIGLVSSHAALPDSLKERFGLESVHFYKTGGEASTWEGSTPEPFAVWHPRLKQELRSAPGQILYLVAAGPMAKVYCALIKESGGVAIDIGSVADVWMKHRTRHFNKDFDSFALTDKNWNEPDNGPH